MRLARLFLILVPMLLFGTVCSNDKQSSPLSTELTAPGGENLPEGGTLPGTLKLYLTDAPGEFSEVNITFSEVSVKTATEWITVSEQEQTFDLLSLTGGLTALLGEETLEPGEYGQVRLLIKEAEVVIGEGEEKISYTLQIPSGSASGLKIGHGFTIEAGEVLELVIDFDAARSIHKLGSNDIYQLKPVLRLVTAEASGSITGTVTNPTSGLMANAILGSEIVASIAVDETTGEFTLAFLPADTYTVTITDSDDNELFSQSVEVTAGSTNNLGEITLDYGSE
jgi:hypothetical protein